jgi:hypothetical protein
VDDDSGFWSDDEKDKGGKYFTGCTLREREEKGETKEV